MENDRINQINQINQVKPAHYSAYKQSIYYHFVKRCIDIIVSSALLILLFPLFIVIFFSIKLMDPKGPVLFIQERVGLNERRFNMYKFRSMCSDAEDKLDALLSLNEVEGAMFKMKEDPRITGVGRYLRKFSLDELPQLINVLKGDMSLIGPRPCLNREFMEYTEYDKQRLLVMPGITGLWQISGRSGLSFEQMIELDLNYIEQASITNDFKILFKTIRVVCSPGDAY